MNSIRTELVPSKEKMMGWITAIFNQGIRRPGYPANYRVENWVKEQLENLGLQDIKLDPVPIRKWEAETGNLRIWPVGKPDQAMDIPGFPLPYSRATDGVEAELRMISATRELAGKIAVYNMEFVNLPARLLKLWSKRYYDPGNEFRTLNQMLPFGVLGGRAMEPAMNANASAFIGILSNYPGETHDYYVPYDAVTRDLPGVWVSPNNGKKILELMDKGSVSAKVSYQGGISDSVSHNILASLPGMSEEWVVIGTHHDGPWSSAVEDASGMALVLAQAEYWSQIPREQRPHNILFLMNCGHMSGGAGAKAFVERNAAFLEKIVAAIHLEHVAVEVKSENGKLAPTDEPVVRWWFTSRITPLEEITENAFATEGLRRSIVMPPDGFPPGGKNPPTDAAAYHLVAVPVPFVSLLAAPVYLFDSADTLDKIHQESLEPLTRAVIRIVNALKGHTAHGLRQKVRRTLADKLGLRALLRHISMLLIKYWPMNRMLYRK